MLILQAVCVSMRVHVCVHECVLWRMDMERIDLETESTNHFHHISCAHALQINGPLGAILANLTIS